jgi:hypothetical protein
MCKKTVLPTRGVNKLTERLATQASLKLLAVAYRRPFRDGVLSQLSGRQCATVGARNPPPDADSREINCTPGRDLAYRSTKEAYTSGETRLPELLQFTEHDEPTRRSKGPLLGEIIYH